MGHEKCKERRDAETEGAVSGGIAGGLIGAIVAGPIGFVAGTVVGAIYNSNRRGEEVRKHKNRNGKCSCRR